jgi:hypothetical protein
MKQRLQFRAAKVEPPVQSVPPLLGVEPISFVPPEGEEGPSENPCEENVVDKKEKVLDTRICLFFVLTVLVFYTHVLPLPFLQM